MNADWDESKVHRDQWGQFSSGGVEAWVQKISDMWGKNFDRRALSHEAHQNRELPEGHSDATIRLMELRDDEARGTLDDDGRAEIAELEDAFATYRNHLDLHPDKRFGLFRSPKGGRFYDEFGEEVDLGRATSAPPQSMQFGYRRIGDHPEGRGALGGHDPRGRMPSSHLGAGGIWIDPKRPGTAYAPRYVDDFGAVIAGMQPKESPSSKRKTHIQDRRRGELGRLAEDGDSRYWETHGAPAGYGGRKYGTDGREGTGRFGYAARDEGGDQTGVVFVARMKRLQARARQETARQPVRRTPRGTPIEGWMDQVNARIAQTRGGR